MECIEYGNGGSVHYGYIRDTLGRVTARTATNTDVHKTTYEYVAGGYGENSTTNLVSAVKHMSSANVPRLSFAYEYDDRGNITSEIRDGIETKYEYDALGQLVWEKRALDQTAWKFTYDHGGNILSKVRYAYVDEVIGDAVESIPYAYNAEWKDQLEYYNGQQLSYDAIGNLISDGTWTYTWQHGRQLACMESAAKKIEFKYDHNGLRVEKKVANKADNTVETTKYVYHGKKLMEQQKGEEVLHFYYDAEGRPAMVAHNGEMYTYLHSLQGDIVGIVDSAGNMVVEYKYDAWGKPLSMTGSHAATLGAANGMRYRGYVYDAENGLYYLRSRFYNPVWGRFVNADTLLGKVGALGTHNLFTYCNSSPLVYRDSDGKERVYINFYFDSLFDYGHTDLSIGKFTASFGRYGEVDEETFGLTGEGILVVDTYEKSWDSVETGGVRIRFELNMTAEEINRLREYYMRWMTPQTLDKKYEHNSFEKRYNLGRYHIRNKNCTTMSMAALKYAYGDELFTCDANQFWIPHSTCAYFALLSMASSDYIKGVTIDVK